MRSYKLLILLFFLFVLGTAFAAEIQEIEIDKHKYYDNLLIKTSDYLRPKVVLLSSPPRLVIDFYNTKARPKIYYNLKSKRIKKIRVSKSGRVVVDLKYLVDYENASIFGKNQAVIEIRDKTRPSIYSATKAPPPSKAISSLPKLKVKKIAPSIVRVSPSPRPTPSVLKGKVIVVDPGHGGSDPGAFGLNGLVERDITLKTAYKLVEFLKKAGAKVYLTRKKNVKVGLKDVVAFTNKIKADAYIGIHFNSTEYQKVNGMETYYSTGRSKKLAEILHKYVRKKIKRKDRGVRRARFYTIHNAYMPAVIVEPAYLTNPAEAKLLQSDKFLKGVAWGVVSGLKEYFKWRK
ncbi:MAG: N-acetylmuramoyl-L-alanine amidase [Candidatus Saganbacteria bacterium]|nr:N-acetylmuramoyl-L-alanine amidase [Candidatus Saganbacteria bacterium]